VNLRSALIGLLNEMRLGKVTAEARKTFESLSREVQYDDGTEPVHLYVLSPRALSPAS
jgi:hypothetical protein